MFDENEIILFDINNLISPSIKDLLENKENITEKAKLLISLISFSDNFREYKDEINDFYFYKTSERYNQPYLSEDDKSYFITYSTLTNDLNKTINLLNRLCSNHFHDEAVDEASNIIYEIKSRKSIKIFDDLDITLINTQNNFDSISITKNEQKKSLSEQLNAAKEKINNKE